MECCERGAGQRGNRRECIVKEKEVGGAWWAVVAWGLDSAEAFEGGCVW